MITFSLFKSHYRECHIFRTSHIIKRFLTNLTFMGLCDICTHTPSDVRFITYKEKGSGQSTGLEVEHGHLWPRSGQLASFMCPAVPVFSLSEVSW